MDKQFDIEDLNEELSVTNMANIFFVYDDNELGVNTKIYNINRTLNLLGLDNISNTLFKEYVVKDNDTWHLISYNHYGVVDLWWLVCKMNNINNPLDDPEVGAKLKILKNDLINEILNEIRES